MGQNASTPSSNHIPNQGCNSNNGGVKISNSNSNSNSKGKWFIVSDEDEDEEHEEKLDFTLGLPDECVVWVFGKLSSCKDRNACSLVCKRWNLIESKSRYRLVLLARSELSPFLPPLLSRFNSLSILSLKCSRKLVSIDDDSLSIIPSYLSSLKKLKLKGCVDISDDGLHAFSLHRPAFLTKLSFASCTFTARGINSLLSNCSALQDLTLKRLRKLDAQNIPLTLSMEDNQKGNNQSKLERLCLKDLHNARIFTSLLCSSKELKTLIVCRSSGNWDQVLENLQQGGGGTSVTEIQMENVQLGDAGLIAISSVCLDLQVLNLSRASDCTDNGFSAIANSCGKLRKLHIDACRKFGSRSLGDEGVVSLATKCSQLQEVVLMGVPITILSLDALASNCPVLERLALCNTDSMGDPEMAFMAAKFSALKKLCIKNCAISDSGVEAIGAGCPNLVKLKIKRCRGVTQESVFQLRLMRSSLAVSVDSGSVSFEDEEIEGPVNNEIAPAALRGNNAAINGGRRTASVAAGTNTRATHVVCSSTHVVCSSRGANLIKSKLENALQFKKPSNSISRR